MSFKNHRNPHQNISTVIVGVHLDEDDLIDWVDNVMGGDTDNISDNDLFLSLKRWANKLKLDVVPDTEEGLSTHYIVGTIIDKYTIGNKVIAVTQQMIKKRSKICKASNLKYRKHPIELWVI